MKLIALFSLIHALSLVQAFAPNSSNRINKSTTRTTPSSSHTQTQTFRTNTNTNTNALTILNLKDENMTEEERAIALEKATAAMTKFSNRYIQNTDTKYCSDKAIPAVVIKGLAEHKVTLGAPLCPCRYYEDKEKEAKDGFWNCPCVPMRERHECHCMLFLTEDNAFAGDETVITVEEVVEKSGTNMKPY